VDQITAAYFYNVQAVVPVGSDPFGVAVDPANKEVFVTNMGSDNVSIINGTSQLPVGNVTVQSHPEGIVFDPIDNALFVADNGSDDVSVISVATLSVVANVAVGTTPAGVAWDNASDRVFVTNRASDNVSVISGATDRVLASVPVGSDPFGIADDNSTGRLYVANEGSNNVSVLSADPAAVNATVPIATDFFQPPPHLEDVAYDSIHQMIWVTAGLTVVVIDAAAARAVDEVAFDPSGIAFDPQNDTICETNSVNTTSGCFVYGGSGAYGSFNRDPVVTFSEQGLPAGVGWNVTMGSAGAAVTQDSSAGSIVFGVDAGVIAEEGCPCGYSYPYVATSVVIGGPPQTIAGNVTNDSMGSENESVLISFATQGEYPVAFRETGLPPSINWGVNLSGSFSWAASGSPVTFGAANGSYNFTLGGPAGYRAAPSFGSVTVNGTNVTEIIVFTQLAAAFPVVFLEYGLPAGDGWELQIGNLTMSAVVSSNQGTPQATGRALEFELPNGTYSPEIWSPSGYYGLPYFVNVTVAGVGQNLTIEFAKQFTVAFTEHGLPGGSNWSITYFGWPENVTVPFAGPSTVDFFVLNGTWTFEVRAPRGFLADPSSGSVTVAGSDVNRSIQFERTPETYSVVFNETGLPNGTSWSVTLNGTSVSGVGNLSFPGVVNGTYNFAVPDFNGYVPVPTNGSVVVGGSSTHRTIGFQQQICCEGPPPHSTAPSTFLGLPPVDGYALLAGLISLVVLGVLVYLVRRRRDREP
jgi:YVTN family beta-propeller protein